MRNPINKAAIVFIQFLSLQQTKRKLDDAAKRLGCLYDKLREQSVRNCSMPCCPRISFYKIGFVLISDKPALTENQCELLPLVEQCLR